MFNLIRKYPYLGFVILLTLVFSILLLVPNYRHFPIIHMGEFIFVMGHWALSSLGLLAILILLSLNRYIFAVLFPIFVFISSVTAFFAWHIDVSINTALVESIFNTDVWEISSYLSYVLVVFVTGCFLLAVFFVVVRFRIRWTQNQLIPVVILFMASVFLFVLTNRVRLNTLMMRSPFSYYQAFSDYLKDQREMKKDRLLIGQDSYCEADSMLTILIIGEALRSDHVQMNGYERVTMPNMERRGVISYPFIYTPYTHTVSSLRYFLTRSSEEFSEPMYEESSFINAFKTSGFYTSWVANQNPLTPLRFFISESDTVIVNKPEISDYSNMQKLDSDLIPHFTNLIAEKHSKKLIILHLAGNHWWYNKNFPDDFAVFTPVLESRELSYTNRERMINSYDNVTLFVDHVIDQLMEAIQDKKAFLIFLSDHGQSFGEDGKWLHANNTPAEQNPACFIWFSEGYSAAYPHKVEAVSSNRKKQIDTSFLFHTILDGSLIRTHYLDPELSFFRMSSQPKKADTD